MAEEKQCRGECKAIKPLSAFYERGQVCKDCYNKNRREARKTAPISPEAREKKIARDRKKDYNDKIKVFALYNDKCCMCDFVDPCGLMIEHNGTDLDNLAKRKHLYRHILKGDTKIHYCLICANCSQIRQHTDATSVYQTNKMKVLEHYGKQCACGFNDVRALTIEAFDREAETESGNNLYFKIVQEGFKPDYYTICCRCKYIKNG